jgi:hypothetical protein
MKNHRIKDGQMRLFMMWVLCLVAVATYGQEAGPAFDGHTWEAPYFLPVPDGWTVERFPVPIAFAPEIPYKGVEDIRFAPGWGKADSDGYWSYAFLWYLEGEVSIDVLTLERNLKDYYTGLIAVNGSKIPSEKLVPVISSFREERADPGDSKTFAGTIKMPDYMQQKPIVLQCRAHLRSCPGEKRTFLFFELSPKLRSHGIWMALDNLWHGFKCTKD